MEKKCSKKLAINKACRQWSIFNKQHQGFITTQMNGKRRPLPHSWSSNHQQREALLTASNSRQSHCWPNVQLEKIDSVHCAAFSMRKNREKKQFSSFNKQHYAWQRRENICCFLGRYYFNKGTGKALVKLRNNFWARQTTQMGVSGWTEFAATSNKSRNLGKGSTKQFIISVTNKYPTNPIELKQPKDNKTKLGKKNLPIAFSDVTWIQNSDGHWFWPKNSFSIYSSTRLGQLYVWTHWTRTNWLVSPTLPPWLTLQWPSTAKYQPVLLQEEPVLPYPPYSEVPNGITL